MLEAAIVAIFSRVATVALPMCGRMTQLGSCRRGLSRGSGSGTVTSSPAAPITPCWRAATRSSCTTTSPLVALMKMQSLRIFLKRDMLKKPRVASLRGNMGTTKSLLAKSSSSDTKTAPSASASGFLRGPVYRISHPNALSLLLTACPMRPNPTMPTVDECTSLPHSHRGSHVPQLPSLAAAMASPKRLAVAMSSATVRSAVVSVRQSGVKPRGICLSLRTAVSMWL
mmetsp:Transcript_2146/g.5012  ORF Transcript_2146/g.5012 Transcript_2146/m.5012 type:complete len:227 (+) Transcript_2146:276-956(+)